MKAIMIVFINLCGFITLAGQQVEVIGSLKVTEMDTVNTEGLLVVKQEDGTLATRQASSLSSPIDTSRTFERDLELSKVICDCPYLPPFLVESALENGYTENDLLSAGVQIESILAGGGNPINLLEAGASPVALVSAGVIDTVLYGNFYQGGYIFHINAVSGYALVAGNALGFTDDFGCNNIDVPTAEGIAIGTGIQNTQSIIAECGSGTAAYSADLIEYNGFDDWFLPSLNESIELFNVLHEIPNSSFTEDLGIMSSTDYPGNTNTNLCKGAYYPVNGTEAIEIDFFKSSGAIISFALVRMVN